MTDDQLKALMALMMVSDPWPLSELEKDALISLVNHEARRKGYTDWLDAYHKM